MLHSLAPCLGPKKQFNLKNKSSVKNKALNTVSSKGLKNMLDNFSIKNKPLIVTGDFNVVHQQKDIWNIPSFIKLRIAGIFDVGMYNIDRNVIFMPKY